MTTTNQRPIQRRVGFRLFPEQVDQAKHQTKQQNKKRDHITGLERSKGEGEGESESEVGQLVGHKNAVVWKE